MAAERGKPIATTAAWRAAVDAADGQCQHTGKSDRCSHTLNGGYRLYLDSDGRVYCSDHHAPRKPAPAAAAPLTQQDSLF